MTIKLSPEKIAYLNLGCGHHFSSDWNNLDLVGHEGVEPFDIRQRLPYPQGSFDVVYSSHVLEHLTPDDGAQFLGEKYRVLKPGGICRIAVPDLEKICRAYLRHLEESALSPTQENLLAYNWSVLQLLDQLVRDKPGGRMLEALQRGHYDAEFVSTLFGDEFGPHFPGTQDAASPAANRGILFHLARRVYRFVHPVRPVDPRKTGENHRWLYDRLSLKLALSVAGFEDFGVKTHLDSNIPHWAKYNLDLSDDGKRARKPDSIFVEARKPPDSQPPV
jgi:SAM-dependent methyltransferase